MVFVRLAMSFNNRDKYRERFDIPDHPLWESLQLNRKCSSTSMRKYMARSETTDDSNQTSDTQISCSNQNSKDETECCLIATIPVSSRDATGPLVVAIPPNS